ncbi:MAG: hypothetical protein KGZ82_13190 [Bacteroidales bacterium]|nr:hypothetical protein [Bacteroidales bacterium]
MSIRSIRKNISRNLVNFSGWRTERKIVVIESDDWGSIRMPSFETYQNLLRQGIRVDKCPYNRNDSLASEDDLSALFDVLSRFNDKNGNHPVITANTVVANPDFEKIRQSNYMDYHYEPFTETLKKIPVCYNALELWKQGMDYNIFHPQFHGREHVNILLWMKLLQSNTKIFRIAFDYGLWGLGKEIVDTGKINIQSAYDTLIKEDILFQKDILKEGLILFEQVFGFKSKSFIANNYIWDDKLNKTLSEGGVSILQGMKYQISPIYRNKSRRLIKHKTGEFNTLNQVYLVRNCHFEPSVFPETDSVISCMNDINNAFIWHKPAIISSHRLNFIGSIIESNRTRNLKFLDQLLQKIIIKWPNVEFKTSVELGNLIESQRLKNLLKSEIFNSV